MTWYPDKAKFRGSSKGLNLGGRLFNLDQVTLSQGVWRYSPTLDE